MPEFKFVFELRVLFLEERILFLLSLNLRFISFSVNFFSFYNYKKLTKLFFLQAYNVVLDAYVPDVFTYHPDHPLVLPDAHLHDLQRLVVFRRSFGCSDWLLPFWLEKIRNCGRYRTLPLVYNLNNSSSNQCIPLRHESVLFSTLKSEFLSLNH